MDGTRLIADRYQLLERLGKGAVGQVWRARDLVLERTVAVKVVDLARQDDPAAAERFRREAVATAGLSHPNVVGVFDAGTDDQLAFLVMELLTGPDLRQRVRDRVGPGDFTIGLPVMRQVALGLQAAHRIGIVHRDIKPANLVLHDGTPKIVDFGIATLSDANATLTAPSTTIGTANYMAPEQALGQPVTPACDWYAFGACLMTMFSGRPPFTGDSPLAVASAQISQTPPKLSDRRPDCPPALEELVDRLLAKRAEDRPSGTDVIGELDRMIANPGVISGLGDRTRTLRDQAPVPAAVPVPAPPPQRTGRRLVPVLIALALLAAGFAMGGWLLSQRDASAPTASAPTPTSPRTSRSTAQPAPAVTITRTGSAPTNSAASAWSPSASTSPASTSPTSPTGSASGWLLDQASQVVVDAITMVTDDKARADLLSRWDKVISAADAGDLQVQIDRFVERLDKLTESGALGPAQSALIKGATAAYGDLFD